jgi:hypothetical protein
VRVLAQLLGEGRARRRVALLDDLLAQVAGDEVDGAQDGRMAVDGGLRVAVARARMAFRVSWSRRTPSRSGLIAAAL